MKLKKSDDENNLINSLKNMRINTKKRRQQILRNVQTGSKLLRNDNLERFRSYKSCRPFNLSVSRGRRRRFSAQYGDDDDGEGGDNASPTRAYHSDSETVVRKDRDTVGYRSQSNDMSSRFIVASNSNNNPSSAAAAYPSSEASYSLAIGGNCRCLATVLDNANSAGLQPSLPLPLTTEIHTKRFSLRESSTSLFGSILIDTTKSTNIVVERSPSLQHILCGCSSSIDTSPFFRTPMSTMSGGGDQLTATTTTTSSSSRVSCSSEYSHSAAIFQSDDIFHLSQYQKQAAVLVTTNNNESPLATVAKRRPNYSIQPHFLSSDVDLSRQQQSQQQQQIQNNPNSSCDSSATMDDLSSYMDLMIHIPKMHI